MGILNSASDPIDQLDNIEDGIYFVHSDKYSKSITSLRYVRDGVAKIADTPNWDWSDYATLSLGADEICKWIGKFIDTKREEGAGWTINDLAWCIASHLMNIKKQEL